ncbi:site-specific integrase [Variovorax sp. YR216]|uniref:site-specific integrase n=1 Tax=Variovorax sp. YR216 TaxID=1882828 RepID=UPI00089B6B2D|nr:site-specific integrase [Variovorax sp. YR216]SEB22614.1 Phage integrase family protein [Variovorax sp. YR216]
MDSQHHPNPRPRAATGSATAALEAPAEAAVHPLATLADRSAALDPKQFARAAEAAARALLRQGESTNTRTSYNSAMRYWCAWYAARYGTSLVLPVPVPVVVQFIVDHAARRPDEAQEAVPREADGGARSSIAPDAPNPPKARKQRKSTKLVTELPPDVDEALVRSGYKARLGPPALNTLVHRISVLSKAHQMAATRAAATAGSPDSDTDTVMANPCADPLVRELLARTRRAYAQRGARPKRQRALTKDPLQLLLATCDESLKGKRDRALLVFGWATGGRRRSEIASATLENLQRIDAESFVYTLAHSKTNQRGDLRPEDVKPLVGTAAAAMQEWLAVLKAQGVQEGPIFRRIRRGGHLAEPLAAAAVRDIVRERCALAGVEGSFSAHSLRAGFVTEAGRQNMPLPETMAMTGHQSIATVVGYFRAENALTGKLGRLLDETE